MADNKINNNLVTHIKIKIRSLKDEIKALQYTMGFDDAIVGNEVDRIRECTHKIQVLNEILISFGVQAQ